MDVIESLDRVRAERDVLEHPFYQRWSAGELSREELALYAGQYRHAVVALAEASRLAAEAAPAGVREGLARHAEEEREHVAIWDGFAAACGGRPDALALEQTARCAERWTAGEDLLEHLAVLYAIEASQPEISRTKLDGLREHYGYVAEGPAAEYFRRARAARRRARPRAAARELIARADSSRRGDRAASAAERGWCARAEDALRGELAAARRRGSCHGEGCDLAGARSTRHGLA